MLRLVGCKTFYNEKFNCKVNFPLFVSMSKTLWKKEKWKGKRDDGQKESKRLLRMREENVFSLLFERKMIFKLFPLDRKLVLHPLLNQTTENKRKRKTHFHGKYFTPYQTDPLFLRFHELLQV